MNQHQLTAMLHRELLDVRYNGQVVTLMFLPLFALLTVLFTDNSTSWSFPLILTLYFFPMHMQGFILVEEKEQRTWRILRQQGITLFHLTLVKTLFTLFVSLLTMFGLVYAITLSLTEALLTSLFLIPVLLIMVSFGTILAALFKNTIEVSLWGSPLFALLFVLELPNRFLYETAWYPYIELLPHSVFFQGIAIIRTEPAQAFLFPFLYLTITAILIIFLTNYVLRKKEATFKP